MADDDTENGPTDGSEALPEQESLVAPPGDEGVGVSSPSFPCSECDYVGASPQALRGHRGAKHKRWAGREKAPVAALEAPPTGAGADEGPIFADPREVEADARLATALDACAAMGCGKRELDTIRHFWPRTSISSDGEQLARFLARFKTLGEAGAAQVVDLIFPRLSHGARMRGAREVDDGPRWTPAPQPAVDVDRAVREAVAREREAWQADMRASKLEDELKAMREELKAARAAPAAPARPAPEVEALKAQVAALSTSLTDKRTQEQIAAAVNPVLAEIQRQGREREKEDLVTRVVKAQGPQGMSPEATVAVKTLEVQLEALKTVIRESREAYQTAARMSQPMSPGGGAPTQAMSADEMARAGIGTFPVPDLAREERGYPGGARFADQAGAEK